MECQRLEEVDRVRQDQTADSRDMVKHIERNDPYSRAVNLMDKLQLLIFQPLTGRSSQKRTIRPTLIYQQSTYEFTRAP